ncbi:hypothetical protein ACUNWD_03880 [Sunxiuqinia sp. A32]|uniref:hypothetical protein n=1 Tax=Sunxiuqinia sp. A32 TaxID=3461496 RepID=UPI004046246F
MFSAGNLLLIRNFELNSGITKDKFLIVIAEINESTKIVASFTTSQAYINQSDIKPGCIKTETKHCYHFPKGKVISDCGFSFRKDTFVFLFHNVIDFDIQILQAKYPHNEIEVMCKLSDDEYCDLLYCVYNGPFVSKKVKRTIEPIIESLVNKIESRDHNNS